MKAIHAAHSLFQSPLLSCYFQSNLTGVCKEPSQYHSLSQETEQTHLLACHVTGNKSSDSLFFFFWCTFLNHSFHLPLVSLATSATYCLSCFPPLPLSGGRTFFFSLIGLLPSSQIHVGSQHCDPVLVGPSDRVERLWEKFTKLLTRL